jgi:hypothetical protein
MKPSMWYLDDNRWEAGQQQIVNKTHISFFLSWFNSSFHLLGRTNVIKNKIGKCSCCWTYSILLEHNWRDTLNFSQSLANENQSVSFLQQHGIPETYLFKNLLTIYYYRLMHHLLWFGCCKWSKQEDTMEWRDVVSE